jgi:hypothetical protein
LNEEVEFDQEKIPSLNGLTKGSNKYLKGEFSDQPRRENLGKSNLTTNNKGGSLKGEINDQ